MDSFRFIDDASVERLRNHKFTSAGLTPLDRLMTPFWDAMACRVPHSISPNLVSVIGGVCAFVSSPISIVATRFSSPALYFVAPMFMFVYVTADAVDGKHARLTGQSSPLGAVVDHGIDAFTAFTTGLAVCNTVDPALSTTRLMAAYCLFHSSWFCAQWGELELGALDQRGITEGEFATMLVLSLPGLVALDFFRWRLWLLGGLEVGCLVEVGVIVGCGAVTVAFFTKILSATPLAQVPRVFMPFAHLCLHNAVGVLLSATAFGRRATLLSFAVVGMDAAVLMTKMRFAATVHCAWPLLHVDMLPFLVVAAAEIAGAGLGTAVFGAVLLWQGVCFVLLWHDTITRICRVLNVPFLAARPQKPE